MPDIVVTEFMDGDAVAELSRDFDVQYDSSLVDDHPRLREVIVDARALIVRNRTAVDASLLDHAPKLQVVGRLGVGLDNIDLDACERRGVAVRPATGANADAVAEYVIAATFLLRRGAFESSGNVATGEWPRTALVGHEVAGATLGLVGFGDIARRVAGRARALGMDVVAFDPFVDPVAVDPNLATVMDLDELLAVADVVSVHVPLTETTTGMMGADAFVGMKPSAVLINTSRGGIVDEEALVDALVSGEIGGAALDVFATEPVTQKSGARFKGVPGLILTPHIAGVTIESNTRVSAMVAAAVHDVLSGGVPG